jgi:hypothetical protein
MRPFWKGFIAGFFILVMIGSAFASVLPREPECNKSKAFSLSSEIKTETIKVSVENTSVCSYEVYLLIEIRDMDLKLVMQFLKPYTVNGKSIETYTIEGINKEEFRARNLVPSHRYYLVMMIEDDNTQLAKRIVEFVYGV